MNQKHTNTLRLRPARELSALRIGNGDLRYLEISSREELSLLHALFKNGEYIHISGEGTNSVYGTYSGVVVCLNTHGYEWIDERILRIEGGEHWQHAVDLAVEKSLHGIERLTQIPGSVGAAPVQNIGAFGQLLSDRIDSIEVYDFSKDEFITLNAHDCGFGEHRKSNFKSLSQWSTYVIVSLTLSLLTTEDFMEPSGEGLMSYAKQHSLPYGDIKQTEELVRKFRSTLYPDYTLIPNCGSYFTNYEITIAESKKLPESIWMVKHKPTRDGKSIMFQCKDLLRSIGITAGHRFSGGLMMHPEFNNFLINNSSAGVNDLLNCHNVVNSKLMKAYGIELIPEPEFVDDSIVRQVV